MAKCILVLNCIQLLSIFRTLALNTYYWFFTISFTFREVHLNSNNNNK